MASVHPAREHGPLPSSDFDVVAGRAVERWCKRHADKLRAAARASGKKPEELAAALLRDAGKDQSAMGEAVRPLSDVTSSRDLV